MGVGLHDTIYIRRKEGTQWKNRDRGPVYLILSHMHAFFSRMVVFPFYFLPFLILLRLVLCYLGIYVDYLLLYDFYYSMSCVSLIYVFLQTNFFPFLPFVIYPYGHLSLTQRLYSYTQLKNEVVWQEKMRQRRVGDMAARLEGLVGVAESPKYDFFFIRSSHYISLDMCI